MSIAITKEMTLAEVLEANPLAAGVLLEEGMSCVGCSIAGMETLQEGAEIHGIDPDELVARLNEQLRRTTTIEEDSL